MIKLEEPETPASRTPEFFAWVEMRKRCRNPNHNRYYVYGGKGIKFCERWNEFKNFIEDMGEKPSPKHSLDRINNNGNYEPNNCRWATREEQQNNTSRNVFISFNGKTQTVSQWAKELNVNMKILHFRLKTWDVKRALTEPIRKFSKITYNGKTLNISQWSKEMNIPINTLRYRLKHSWSFEQAIVK